MHGQANGRWFIASERGGKVAVGKSQRADQTRYASLSSGQSLVDKASWEDADQEELWRAIVAITDAGDAVTLGRTRDGGALSLTILSGDDRVRLYAHGADETAELLSKVRVALEATD